MTSRLDEVHLKIEGRTIYLGRGVGAEGKNLDVLVRSERNKNASAAQKFLLSHAAVHNALDVQRHLVSARTRRPLRAGLKFPEGRRFRDLGSTT
ncbi:MAG: DDE-type integrase/transposase/recombinase [Roseiarcus sp.]